jgi:hypothetical protein
MHIDADWFSRTIWRYDPRSTSHDRYESSDVLIPANALSWFQSLPSEYARRRETVVYGRVEANRNGRTVLRLLGTQVRRDMNGNGEITW